MKFKRIKGFTMIELLSVILILSIISLIVLAIKINLDRATKNAYYNSLEGTISLAGRDYFSDNIDERPDDTDYASLIEINSRKTLKNLEKRSYTSKVLDMKENECPGKVISYLDADGEYTYLACLECADYETSDRVCSCEEVTTVDETTGEEYTTCKLDEIPAPTLQTVYKDNPSEVYKSFGADGETFTYDDAIWTSRSITITYTTSYQHAKKIRVVDETDAVMANMSCSSLTGTTTKTCSADVEVTTHGEFRVWVVDDLNRTSSSGVKPFYLKVDKTDPNIVISAYDTRNQVYIYNASAHSLRNLNLVPDINPIIAPSGYTYKWYYSTDLTNGTNRVLITQVNLKANGEYTVQVPQPVAGEEGESQNTEITNVDTKIEYSLDKSDMSLYVNATTRQELIARRYILEITTGANKTNSANQNARINRPAAKVVVTGKKAKSGVTYKSGAWSNEDVILIANITDPVNYGVKRWVKKNISTGVETVIPGTSQSITVSSMSTNLGDEYTAVIALQDNTDEEESDGFIVKIDKTNPVCGSVSGASTSWTRSSRTISVKCSDTISGCTESKFSKTFSSSTKTSSITIKDKAGNTKSCSVNVYVDKGAPSVSISCGSCSGSGTGRTCTCTVSASDSYSGVSYKKYAVGYSCGSYRTYSGGYTFYPDKYVTCAYAVDRAGNRSGTVSK